MLAAVQGKPKAIMERQETHTHEVFFVVAPRRKEHRCDGWQRSNQGSPGPGADAIHDSAQLPGLALLNLRCDYGALPGGKDSCVPLARCPTTITATIFHGLGSMYTTPEKPCHRSAGA